MDDRSYVGLARFRALIKECKSSMKTHDCIEEIFKDNDINYQIPATISFKSEEPEIIGCTALHLALQDDKTDSFEELLNLGADYTIRNDKGMTVLHQAIRHSHNKSREFWKLKGQLIHPRASLVLSAHVKDNNLTNPSDEYGMSHFHIACMLNHTKAVKFFLDGGVSANEAIKANSSRLPSYTPLHIAARYCCVEAVKLLMDYGANRYSKDIKNMTPLHLLLERRMEIIDHMLTHKRAAYDLFKEELDLNDKIVKLFINVEDCSASDVVGLSGFQVACTLQDTAIVEKFLEQNVDFDHSISEDSSVWPGYTALHFSVHCNFETVKLLLSRGANVLAKDASGVTPLDLCLKTHKVESLHIVLMSAISQLNLETICFSDGKTKLVDLVYAMRSELELDAFVTASLDYINVFIPRNSPVWPGYTPMHLAVALPERKRGIKDLYQTTDYEEECPSKYYNCQEIEETLYKQRILRLFRAGADLTISNVDGSTPIHLAFPLKSERIFNLLLNNQWNILNPVDKRGLSHLHIACAMLQRPFVERMLPTFSENVDDQTISRLEYQFVDQPGYKIKRISVNAGSTLMHIAAAVWDRPMMETLLRHKANIYVQDSLGMTPIHLILKSAELVPHPPPENPKYRGFPKFLSSDINWADCVTDFGLSHLHVASYMNDADVIRKLLDAGAKIETTIKYEPSEELSFLAKYDSYTPLHMALREENNEATKTLAERGADCLAKEPGDCALLHKSWYQYGFYTGYSFFASIFKSDAIMQKRLFECFGWTKLHIACIIRDIDWAEELLKNGANPNAHTNSNNLIWSGCSPLHVLTYNAYSLHEGEHRMMKLLLDHGADVTLANSEGCTPVHKCFFVYSLGSTDGNEYVALLLKYQKDYSVNPINAEGVSHFHAACESGNATIVKEFLKHGVDIDHPISGFPKSCRDFRIGYTPLHLALHSSFGGTYDLLLKYGADVNARDCLGNSPLHTAAKHSRNFESKLKNLVSAGADVHARTLLGATVLEKLASNRPGTRGIELLTKHGHRVNSFNPLTQQGLIGLSACQYSNVVGCSFYKAIIKASDANDLDDMGRTPLHNIVSSLGPSSTMHSFVDIVKELLKIGYDINCLDKKGRTALHCASSFDNYNGIIGLLECGADINITDFDGQTAFTCFLERKSERWDWKKTYIRDIFVEHIYKLNLLKLFVNSLNRNAYAETIRKVDLTKQFILDCQNELEKTKNITISSLSISLFDFLSSETRVIAAYPYMLPQRQAINAFFETNQNVFRQEFQQLYCLLYLQYRKALARNELIESAKYSLNTHLGFDMPDLCSDVIFGFLANEDLRNLISSEDYYPPRKVQRLA